MNHGSLDALWDKLSLRGRRIGGRLRSKKSRHVKKWSTGGYVNSELVRRWIRYERRRGIKFE